MSIHQKFLYRSLLDNDRDQEQLKARGIIEYLVSFLKPEAIKKLLEIRETEKTNEQNKGATDGIFQQQVADMFGKPLQSSG